MTGSSVTLPVCSTLELSLMVNRNLIRNLDDEDIASELAVLAPEEEADEWLLEWLGREQQDYAQGEIVDGRIVEVNDEWALIDVGFKSEGTVSVSEWGPDEERPAVGQTVKVLIEEMEDELGAADDPYGMISLSKSKAEKIIEWEKIIGEISEGQVVTGTVIGDVHAPGHVELAAQARVHGNVYYSLIEMAMGAEVNGSLVHQSGKAAVKPLPKPVAKTPARSEADS